MVLDKNRHANLISKHIDFFIINGVHNPFNFVKGLLDIFTSVGCFYSCKTGVYPGGMMILPCGSIQYTSWDLRKEVQQIWKINVHVSLMLNITILQAYVPYSVNCSSNNIAVYDGLGVHRESHIDFFCGMIKYESIYSKQNKATIQLQYNASILAHTVILVSTYTVLFSGQARKCLNTSIPQNIFSNVVPSFSLYVQERQFYFWYMCNEIYYAEKLYTQIRKGTRGKGQGGGTYVYIANIEYYLIKIVNLTCTNRERGMFVYPGLLPFYWARWHVQPHTVISCNTTTPQTVKLDFQMHGTLILKMDPFEIMNINFRFDTKQHTLGSYEHRYERNLPRRSFINKDSMLQIDFLHTGATPGALRINQVKHRNQHTTIRSNLVLAGIKSLYKFNDNYNPTPGQELSWTHIIAGTNKGTVIYKWKH